MHGIGGTRRIWDPVVAPLAAEFEVIAVDLPGFGESAPLADGATPDPPTLARVLADHLDARGIATAHLAGSSLGAWIALELARLGRARSVTSLCAAGFWSRPLLADGELPRKPGPRARPRAAAGHGAAAAHAPRAPRRAGDEHGPPRARDPRRGARHRARLRDGARLSGHQPRDAAHVASRAREGIDVPVTLAWGEHDRLVRPPPVPPPGWRTVLLPDCGHLPMWDDPELVVRVIRATASADVSATPASAIAPPTAVSGEGTSPSATQPTSAATGGTA